MKNDKTGAKPSDPAAILGGLDFVSPTEFVELPSKGIFYPDGHPLHNKEVVEIKYMTAKEEDILTSQSLLKKGIAIDRFLQNILVDKNININSLLIGDKNAILIAARTSGYGSEYHTSVNCPSCDAKNDVVFDLEKSTVLESEHSSLDYVDKTSDGTFLIEMPFSKFKVEFALLTGKNENDLNYIQRKKAKGNLADSLVTDQYKMMIKSVNGNKEKNVINYYVENMPARDSRFFKKTYKLVNPDIKIYNNFDCNSCGHIEPLEVPFGVDFLWPDQ